MELRVGSGFDEPTGNATLTIFLVDGGLTALGGFSVNIDLSSAISGGGVVLKPADIRAASTFDIFSANINTGMASAISALGVRVPTTTHELPLFTVTFPTDRKLTTGYQVVVNSTGEDTFFDDLGGSLPYRGEVFFVDSMALGTDAIRLDAPLNFQLKLDSIALADVEGAASVGADIVLTFNQAVQLGTGVVILKTAAGAIVASYDVATSVNLSISGNTLTIDPSLELSYETRYEVEFATGSIEDLAGHGFLGITTYGIFTGNHQNVIPTGSVTISGTPTQGQTLTAANSLADLDGLGDLSYQWSADGTVITGATSSTYVLTQSEVGKAITVSASYTDGFGAAEGVDSSATTEVENTNDLPTGSVTISGTPTQGQTLTAANSLADLDGLGDLSYQWSADGTVITGATSSTYVLTETEVGKTLTVTASYTDVHGTDEFVSSSPTTTVTNVNESPVISSGASASVAENTAITTVLYTASASDPDASDTKTWSLSGTDANLLVIDASTGEVTLNATADFEAKTSYSFSVVATDAGGLSASQAVVLSVTDVNDPPKGDVTIAGIATADQTLSVSNTLADQDGLGEISYQWSASGVAITGATSSAYVLTQSEVGKAITVAASYTDGQGNLERATSAEVVVSSGKTVDIQAYSWKAHTLLDGVAVGIGSASQSTGSLGSTSFAAISDTAITLSATRTVPSGEAATTSAAVNLQDAIAILKMIVGLDVNGTGKALSPYQALAADYDGNGAIQLSDAIGVLKHVVGLTAPAPTWHFVNEIDSTVPGKANLAPGVAQTSIAADLSGSSPVHVGLVGYMSGDVDGSFAGASGASALTTSYFSTLVSAHTELGSGFNLAQFGIYTTA
jgi:hypothetical protein